uniref:Uncharacterized protein n=1 Tax=viral metagenome TaxID=1070528 RepID=A0A6C0HUE4_9ZZZZ
MEFTDLYISPQEKLDLKRLLKTSDCDNNTEHIRKVKHSSKIQKDIMEIIALKKTNMKLYEQKPDRFELEARVVGHFLHTNYPDIFRKVINNEINYEIMSRLLHILKGIEEEKVDQHEGSVLVGKVLKELYLDSAVRHGENLDKKHKKMAIDDQETKKEPPVGKLISWKEYKTNSQSTKI